MSTNIVVVASGGLPITEATNGQGMPVSVAANGLGIPCTVVASGGMPVVGSGAAYSAQAIAVFVRLATQPNAARKSRYDTLISSLVAAGVWSALDVLYTFQAHDQATALTNLVSSNFGASATGTPTFTVDGGFASLGVGSFLDSNFNPSVASGVNYLQDSASLFAYSLTSNASSGAIAGYGAGTHGYAEIYPRYVDNSQYTALNDAAEFGVPVTDGSGLIANDRSSSANFSTYANGVPAATNIAVSTALINADITFLTQGTHAYTGSIAIGGAGGHLTTSQHLALYNAILAYLTGLASDYP